MGDCSTKRYKSSSCEVVFRYPRKKKSSKIDPADELITQGRDGEIRSKDTINSNDPIPPKDREN